MHVGNLRTALYTWLIARHSGGTFILRIEDTDQGRLVEGATEVIYNTLRKCGLTWDEGPDLGGPVGPYIQTQRRDLYGKFAELLVEKGHAYYCFCAPPCSPQMPQLMPGRVVLPNSTAIFISLPTPMVSRRAKGSDS